MDRRLTPLALATQLGLTMVVSLLIGLLAGLWLDQQLGTMPLFTLILSLIGITAGSLSAYRLVATAIAAASESPATRAGQPRAGASGAHKNRLKLRRGIACRTTGIGAFPRRDACDAYS